MRSIRRILAVQPYGIGDALFTTPLLRALRLIPSVEAVDLLLGSRTEAVFKHNPHVDQIFSVHKDRWKTAGRREMFREMVSLWRSLRGRYDLLVDFSLQREYGFYAGWLLGIPRRIGFNFKNRGLFLTRSLPLPNGFDGAHAIDFYCELGKLIGLEIEDRFPEFYLSDDDRREILRWNLPESYVAVAPGGGESWGPDAHFKRWPVRSFVEALSFLKEKVNFEGIIILGSGAEKELGEELKEGCQKNVPKDHSCSVLNLCGELSLGACAAVLEKSRLLLANDGGLVHLAHALCVPLVAFYGPVAPQVYGPYPPRRGAASVVKKDLPCRPCYFRFRYNAACVDRECLSALQAAEVFESLDRENYWSHFRDPILRSSGLK